MYCEKYELFCFNLQSSDIVMKLVRIPDSDYADCHTLTCKGIKAFKLHSAGPSVSETMSTFVNLIRKSVITILFQRPTYFT